MNNLKTRPATTQPQLVVKAKNGDPGIMVSYADLHDRPSGRVLQVHGDRARGGGELPGGMPLNSAIDVTVFVKDAASSKQKEVSFMVQLHAGDSAAQVANAIAEVARQNGFAGTASDGERVTIDWG